MTRSQARGVRTLLWSFDTEQSTTSPELRRAADRHRFFDLKLLAGMFQPVDENGAAAVESSRDELTDAESPRRSSMGRVRPSIATFPTADRMLDQARTAAAAFAHRMATSASDSQVAAVLAGRRIPPSDDQQLIRFVLGPYGGRPRHYVAGRSSCRNSRHVRRPSLNPTSGSTGRGLDDCSHGCPLHEAVGSPPFG